MDKQEVRPIWTGRELISNGARSGFVAATIVERQYLPSFTTVSALLAVFLLFSNSQDLAGGANRGIHGEQESVRQGLRRGDYVLRLNVTNAETGKPVPNAAIKILYPASRECVPGEAPVFDVALCLADRIERQGQSIKFTGVTAADGHSVLQCGKPPFSVIAEASGLWGCGQAVAGGPGSPIDCDILMFPDGDLHVEVVDGQGRGVGNVPVILRALSSIGAVELGKSFTANAGGAATMRHAIWQFGADRRDSQGLLAEDHIEYCVELGLCLSTPIRFALDPNRIPADPPRLLIPPTGTVEVEFRNSDGSHMELEYPVMLSRYEGAAGLGSIQASMSPPTCLEGTVPPGAAIANPEGAAAVFEHVGLEMQLEIVARRNRASSPLAVCCQGPRKAGEQTRIIMTSGTAQPSFRGLAIDERGAPVLRKTIQVALFSGPSKTRGPVTWQRSPTETFEVLCAAMQTDDRGQFWLDFLPDSALGGHPLLVLTLDPNSPQARAAVLDLTEAWQPSLTNLGEVRLSPASVLADGVVVDGGGEPIRGALVRILNLSGPDRFSQLTDGEGRFAFYGVEPFDDIMIRAEMGGDSKIAKIDRSGLHGVRIQFNL